MNYPIWDLPILGGGVLIGTIAILHVFVWVWAMEWVAFFTEIAAAFVYYYGWDRLSRRVHLAVGWIYFGGAWLSLFQINGILTFMLTPGRWLESRSLVDAFFNPTMWPSAVIRTAVAVALAGLYELKGFMPPFIGSNADREALTDWLYAIGQPASTSAAQRVSSRFPLPAQVWAQIHGELRGAEAVPGRRKP